MYYNTLHYIMYYSNIFLGTNLILNPKSKPFASPAPLFKNFLFSDFLSGAVIVKSKLDGPYYSSDWTARTVNWCDPCKCLLPLTASD